MSTSIDITYLVEMSDGDNQLMTEILNIYLEQVEEFSTELKNHIQNNDLKSIAAVAHKAKTSCSIVGFKAISAKFVEIEKSIKSNESISKVAEKVNQVIKLLELSISEVNKLITKLQ